jgi:hypothetical protein
VPTAVVVCISFRSCVQHRYKAAARQVLTHYLRCYCHTAYGKYTGQNTDVTHHFLIARRGDTGCATAAGTCAARRVRPMHRLVGHVAVTATNVYREYVVGCVFHLSVLNAPTLDVPARRCCWQLSFACNESRSICCAAPFLMECSSARSSCASTSRYSHWIVRLALRTCATNRKHFYLYV